MSLDIDARSIARNPSPEELQAMTSQMPTARKTTFGNYNVATKVVARSKASTYLVTDDPDRHRGHATISRDEFERVAKVQDSYIANERMVAVDGYIGSNPEFRTGARLVIEEAHANIAGMQRQLYYQGGQVEVDPTTTVVYTPRLPMPGYPNDRLIAVDLDAGVTRVFNSDYFGESKKGGLRMWNKVVYDRGGLPMHAGCKVIPVGDEERVALIVGLSGTGKTTTTFTRQNGSLPVQDDFIALCPGGRVYTTENGCFAKTFGLDPRDEPTIHQAVTSPGAYLENVSQNDSGEVDFYDQSYTQNGRATFEFGLIPHYDPERMRTADVLLILNRNENVIPAVARLRPEQAAAYFMLGETTGTSAGGKEEEGKFLRVPGTNPFFPLPHDHQGNRLLELLSGHPLDVYLLNTGRVGGGDGDERSKKVRIPHSSALVKGIAEGTISWEVDPDFGYEVATSVPEFPDEDADLLQPRRLYEAQGRTDEYGRWVERMRTERREFLSRFPHTDRSIVDAVS
ncbi:MAG: phosphoenolpyruvate carboxykinase [Acidimicrobiia bacterium]